MTYKSLRKRYVEALGISNASLSLSHIEKFYEDYIDKNYQKVKSELERVGYFTLKNKLSIGNSPTTTKDIFITTYFVNMEMADKCNAMLSQKYGSNTNVYTSRGFFVPSTNELAVIVCVNDLDNIDGDLKDTDVRGTIEHELTHAFDSTNKNKALSKQGHVPGVGQAFIEMCMHLGCISYDDAMSMIAHGIMAGRDIERVIYAISALIYKLFTITEFNAHMVSDLEETHRVNYNRSDAVKRALVKDVVKDNKLNFDLIKIALDITPNECPELWNLVGNVLSYMGYNVNKKSPQSVYNYFMRMSEKLYSKFAEKKLKNQSKLISSIGEKNSIKGKIIFCIRDNDLNKGTTFWYSPAGDRNSYKCRLQAPSNKVKLTVNNKPVKIIGNADGILKRALDADAADNDSKFSFAVDNLVDVVVQSLDRHFTNADYDPVYDITDPQDEETISKSNKISSRFADLDWD
jgi:hypothetical protein